MKQLRWQESIVSSLLLRKLFLFVFTSISYVVFSILLFFFFFTKNNSLNQIFVKGRSPEVG